MWKFNTTSNQFEPAASFTGHTGPVITLLFVGNRLYSGSMDNTIRVRMPFISFKIPCSLIDLLLCENVKYVIHSFCDVNRIIKILITYSGHELHMDNRNCSGTMAHVF